MPQVIESYFLMKKMYIDKLQDSTGDINCMIRVKGLTKKSIIQESNCFNDPLKLYNHLYDGNTVSFDINMRVNNTL